MSEAAAIEDKRTVETEQKAIPIICDFCGTPTIPALHSKEADGWLRLGGAVVAGAEQKKQGLVWVTRQPFAQPKIDACGSCIEKTPALKKLNEETRTALERQ